MKAPDLERFRAIPVDTAGRPPGTRSWRGLDPYARSAPKSDRAPTLVFPYVDLLVYRANVEDVRAWPRTAPSWARLVRGS
jgi:hypothetical protein